MSKLILIRGLPGSGKSTLARLLSGESGAKHFEADMYFMRDGVYQFDGSRIADAHAWCQQKTSRALMGGSEVIVSNTFTRWVELEYYVSFCHDFGHDLLIVEMSTQFNSVHDVPESAMNRMRGRWQSNSDIQRIIEANGYFEDGWNATFLRSDQL